jgi:hypothetical protein
MMGPERPGSKVNMRDAGFIHRKILRLNQNYQMLTDNTSLQSGITTHLPLVKSV